MPSELKKFLQEIRVPLSVAIIGCFLIIVLQIARPIVRNKLYRKLIYWRTDISNMIMARHAITCYIVVNESCFETEGDVVFSFQLYKEKNVKVILSEEQKKSTRRINGSEFPHKQTQVEMRRIYLNSPGEKTLFTLKPKTELQNEGWQTVTAKSTIRLAMNEATCVAAILWDFPPKQKPQEHDLYVNDRKCKSYSEYVIYKDYLKNLKERFYQVFFAVLFITIFAGGIITNRGIERRKSQKRRRKEGSVEDKIKTL